MSPAPISLCLAALILAAPAGAKSSTGETVSEGRLLTDVEDLVSFGTRHTLSSQDDPQRGIVAARRWTEAGLRKATLACGGCLQFMLPEDTMPHPVRLVDAPARENPAVLLIGPDPKLRDGMVVAALAHLRADDWIFGYSTMSAGKGESLVASAVPGGRFEPLN